MRQRSDNCWRTARHANHNAEESAVIDRLDQCGKARFAFRDRSTVRSTRPTGTSEDSATNYKLTLSAAIRRKCQPVNVSVLRRLLRRVHALQALRSSRPSTRLCCAVAAMGSRTTRPPSWAKSRHSCGGIAPTGRLLGDEAGPCGPRPDLLLDKACSIARADSSQRSRWTADPATLPELLDAVSPASTWTNWQRMTNSDRNWHRLIDECKDARAGPFLCAVVGNQWQPGHCSDPCGHVLPPAGALTGGDLPALPHSAGTRCQPAVRTCTRPPESQGGPHWIQTHAAALRAPAPQYKPT